MDYSVAQPWHALILLASALCGWGAVAAWRQGDRAGSAVAVVSSLAFAVLLSGSLATRWARRPAGACQDGTEVFVHDAPWASVEAVCAGVDRAALWWRSWAFREGCPADTVSRALDRAEVRVRPIVLTYQGGRARGLTWGTDVEVTWREPPSEETAEVVARLAEHEVGHVVLGACGVADGDHHPLMERLGAP